jgi:Glycosyl transferases group 1
VLERARDDAAGANARAANSSPDAAGAAPAAGARVVVVGMSAQANCGMRDHATLLADALRREGHECSMQWLSRELRALPSERSRVRAWSAQLRSELRERAADAALLHYSPFSYAYRGLPVFVHPVLSAIRDAGAPIVCVAHELAYPWGRGGWRGRVWAATQRASLIQLLGASAAVLVTADFQEQWLGTRAWLPSRPTLMAPVYSNLPPPGARSSRRGEAQVIGLFGYAYQGAEVLLLLDALALLRRHGLDFRLLLLGAPGRSSAVAEQWLEAARGRGIEELVSFLGPLPAQQLSDELAACDVLVSCARLGPSSRKGTLAGALASGAPVLAIDGPRRWSELLDAGALEVVAPTPEALADGLSALLADESRRAALGARGRAFAESRMSVARTTEAVVALLDRSLAGRSTQPARARA